MSTAIDQQLLQAAVGALPAGQLDALRQNALAQFSTMGFPTVREEDWKYTNLSNAVQFSNNWLTGFAANQNEPATPTLLSDAEKDVLTKIDAHWLVVRDGVVEEDAYASLSALPGVKITRLAEREDQSDVSTDSAMSAFNAALLRDGLQIKVAANHVAEKPIGILFIDDPKQAVTQSRLLIECGENAHLSMVECSLSSINGQQFSNSVTQVKLATGSQLDFVRLQRRSHDHLGTNRMHVQLDRDATLNHNNFDFGGSLTRNDLVANIIGAGAAVNLHGLYLAARNQHIDNHTRVEHRVGPATSHEEYRGILNGRSRCVFNGKAIVYAGADGTDANQENHNLLLSDHAEIDTKPELEIYADDVKCSHGATVGQLDASALFYLRSRGLDQDEATQLLTQAFAASILSSLAIEQCRDYLVQAIDQRLTDLIDDNGQ